MVALNNLQGALGRTSGRSYKAAPRQLLQVDSTNASTTPTASHATAAHISKADASAAQQEGENAAREAAKIGREALGNAKEGLVRRDPLTHRESLVIIEQLYALVLEIDQKRRDQPAPEEEEEFAQWYALISRNPLNVMSPDKFPGRWNVQLSSTRCSTSLWCRSLLTLGMLRTREMTHPSDGATIPAFLTHSSLSSRPSRASGCYHGSRVVLTTNVHRFCLRSSWRASCSSMSYNRLHGSTPSMTLKKSGTLRRRHRRSRQASCRAS